MKVARCRSLDKGACIFHGLSDWFCVFNLPLNWFLFPPMLIKSCFLALIRFELFVTLCTVFNRRHVLPTNIMQYKLFSEIITQSKGTLTWRIISSLIFKSIVMGNNFPFGLLSRVQQQYPIIINSIYDCTTSNKQRNVNQLMENKKKSQNNWLPLVKGHQIPQINSIMFFFLFCFIEKCPAKLSAFVDFDFPTSWLDTFCFNFMGGKLNNHVIKLQLS